MTNIATVQIPARVIALPYGMPHKAVSMLMENGREYEDAVSAVNTAYPALVSWALSHLAGHFAQVLRNSGKYGEANIVSDFATAVNEYVDNAAQLGVPAYKAMMLLESADYDVQVASAGLIDA